MESSSLLMSARIQIVDAQLSLVHIPLAQYNIYLPTILKLLFPSSDTSTSEKIAQDADSALPKASPWANSYSFLNVSVTPIEVSILCPQQLAEQLFAPQIASVEDPCDTSTIRASISRVNYLVISVEGGGTEAGQRVLELTGPLALAGISLLFVTTYFSDYILIPAPARSRVVRALKDRGFAFSHSTSSYTNPAAHTRTTSSTSGASLSPTAPGTPPPATVSELQSRTFSLLERHYVKPKVDRSLRLIQCAGRRDNPQSSIADALGLQLGIMKCLIHHPTFFSLTLTEIEAASLLLEESLMVNFGVSDSSPDSVLLGSKEELLIPIMLDLEALGEETTGIVCGVAGRLLGGQGEVTEDYGQLSLDGRSAKIEMSYLSTATAGTVVVAEDDLEEAVRLLRISDDGAIEP